VAALCQRLKIPKNFTQLALLVTEFHLNYHRVNELKNKTIIKLFSQLDAFRRPERFEYFLLACEADAKGRLGFENSSDENSRRFRMFFQAAAQVSTVDIIAQGFTGIDIGEQLRLKRIAAVRACKASLIGVNESN
jgi:tRNA nucleotidyltransferase (CCA-adding enzyme)